MRLHIGKNSTIKKIEKIEDINECIIALYEHINKKCRYGEKIDELSKEERVFFITQMVETEVNNGGFIQFIENSSGAFAYEIVDSFLTIGAEKTAVICQNVLDVLGSDMPKDPLKQEDWLLSHVNETSKAVFAECTEMFYRYDDDLNALNYAYVKKHWDAFCK